MSDILCHIAIQDGKVKRSSLEVLSRFREIAAEHGMTLAALLAGPDAERFVTVAAAYGAPIVYVIEHPLFARHLNVIELDALSRAFEESGASTLAMASTEGAKDVLGALGVRLGASVLPDVSSITRVDGGWEATRPVMASKRMARTRTKKLPAVISVRAGVCTATESPVEPEVIRIPFDVEEDRLRTTIRDIVVSAAGQVDLSEARVVVAAGRGVKDAEGKRLIDELAVTLDAAVGATRAVVENGMFPATAQIGQTGKVVSPDLYIAAGISGAIQHVAGMANSRVIVAINKDPDAPIFRYATYGVVGDLYRILPALVDEIRKAQDGT